MTAQPPVPDSFFSIHRHGFARIAVATPSARNGDPGGNSRAIMAQEQKSSDRHADVVVFPELSLKG